MNSTTLSSRSLVYPAFFNWLLIPHDVFFSSVVFFCSILIFLYIFSILLLKYTLSYSIPLPSSMSIFMTMTLNSLSDKLLISLFHLVLFLIFLLIFHWEAILCLFILPNCTASLLGVRTIEFVDNPFTNRVSLTSHSPLAVLEVSPMSFILFLFYFILLPH